MPIPEIDWTDEIEADRRTLKQLRRSLAFSRDLIAQSRALADETRAMLQRLDAPKPRSPRACPGSQR